MEQGGLGSEVDPTCRLNLTTHLAHLVLTRVRQWVLVMRRRMGKCQVSSGQIFLLFCLENLSICELAAEKRSLTAVS